MCDVEGSRFQMNGCMVEAALFLVGREFYIAEMLEEDCDLLCKSGNIVL